MSNLLISDAMVGLIGFALGMLIVFLGILVLILFVKLAGKIFDSVNEKKEKQTTQKTVAKESEPTNSDELSLETKAVISAVISAYYFGENKKNTCEFKLKKLYK